MFYVAIKMGRLYSGKRSDVKGSQHQGGVMYQSVCKFGGGEGIGKKMAFRFEQEMKITA